MTFANKITLCRILSIPFFIASLIFYTPERNYLRFAALAIFLLAIVSDIVDGHIARTRREKTPAGALLDPLADKALLITAFIFVYRISQAYLSIHLPLWVLLVVVSRDSIILIGCGVILTSRNDILIQPTWWGKLTTFFQMMTIVFVIVESVLAPLLWITASVFTVVSGIDYARKGINILNCSDHDSSRPQPDSRRRP